MAAKGGRSLVETPTWAVAVVCFVLVAISIIIEYIIDLIGKWLTKRNKKALFEALEKIKSELMLLGFMSLLLTVGQGQISKICISKTIGNTWHPCDWKQEGSTTYYNDQEGRRRLLAFVDYGGSHRRVLAAAAAVSDKCPMDKVPFISSEGINQLHLLIFVLAVFHVLYCIITLVLGRAKMRKWKAWEMETQTTEYQFSHDPERFRFARDTSFGRRHLSFWSGSTILLWTVCFFRQFFRSVPKVDYLTLRHGFIIAHLSPQSQTNFNFHKYIERSVEEDFKFVVGISPPIWLLAILFLLFNTHGPRSYLWLPFIPLIMILLVGTKLQVIITKMGLRIQERGEVVRGTPVVQPADDLFWFNRPRLLLYIIHFVLFQNAFQLAFLVWASFDFRLRSCFHENTEDVLIRVSMGIIIQILCSYVILPLYALVTQMGSTMKPTIFNDTVAKALYNWHHTAKKNIKQNRQSESITPLSTRPSTPLHSTSPTHLLQHYQNEVESGHTSPFISNIDNELCAAEEMESVHNRNDNLEREKEGHEPSSKTKTHLVHHEIEMESSDFSFDKNANN